MNSKLIKQILFVFALMVGAITLVSILPTALAAPVIGAEDNVVSDLTGGESSFKTLVLRIVSYFLTFLGLIAVIMIIFGGVTYVTAGGRDEAIGNGKKIIMYALIGLVIILLSFVAVKAVLDAGVEASAT